MTDKEQLSEFFKSMRFSLNKCMEPHLSCSKNTIKAHSIPNAKALGMIEDDGHVSMMLTRIGRDGPEINLGLVGRNVASTFTGFCKEHDQVIFKPIDTETFDASSALHLALIDFRAVTREMYVVWENAVRMQSAYTKAVQEGRDRPNVSSPLGLEATRNLLHSYAMYRYRHQFTLALFAEKPELVQHDIVSINHDTPILAASGFFSFDPILNDNFIGVVLNVVPLNKHQSVVVFSYLTAHASKARAMLAPVLRSNGDVFKYQLSKLMLGRVENFALSPVHVRGWSATKLSAVEDAYRSTILSDPDLQDSVDLMLF